LPIDDEIVEVVVHVDVSWNWLQGCSCVKQEGMISNKVFLMKRLFTMKMSEGGFVSDHLNEFNMVTNQLSSVKVDFDDEVGALLIMCSLPESWNGLVMVVSNFVYGSNTLKFDDVVGVILREEMR
jgi:hypothetical protein